MRCQIQHLQGSKKGQVEEITAQRITLGRNPDNIIAFDPYIDADCSGNHAALEERDDGFIYVVDLKSSNGTFVNGAPVPPTPQGTVVPPGSMVQLCKAGPALKLDYTAGPSKKAPVPKPPPPPPEPGSSNGLIIGLAIGGVVVILLIVLIVVLTSGGGDEDNKADGGATGAEGKKGADVGSADGAGQRGAGAGAVADGGALEDAGGDAAGGGGGAASGIADASLVGNVPTVEPPPVEMPAGAGAGSVESDTERNWVRDPRRPVEGVAAAPAHEGNLPPPGAFPAGRLDNQTLSPLPEHAVLRLGPHRIRCDDYSRIFEWLTDDAVLVVDEVANGRRLRRIDVTTGKELGTLPGGIARSLGDGKRIVHTRISDKVVRILDAESGAELATIPEAIDYELIPSRDGSRVLVNTATGWAVFDTASGQKVRAFPVPEEKVSRFPVGLSSDGRQVTFGHGEALAIFDVESGAEEQRAAFRLQSYSCFQRGTVALNLSAVVEEHAAKMIVHGIPSAKALATIAIPAPGSLLRAALSPDGKLVAALVDEGGGYAVVVHEVASGKKISRAKFDYALDVPRFSPSGKRLSVGTPCGVVLLDTATGKEIGNYPAGGATHAVAVSKDGRGVAAGFDDGTLVVASSSSWRKVERARLGEKPIIAATFTDGSAQRVRALMPGAARTWTWETAEPDAPVALAAAADAKPKGALSAGTPIGAFTTKGGGIALFDVSSGGAPKVVLDKTKEGPRHAKIAALSISPDGKIVASAGAKAPFRAYDTAAKTEWIKLEKGLTEDGSATGFSGDGKLFAFAIGEKGYVFDRDKKKRRELELEVPGPDAIALSQDGALLAMEGAGHAILVYEVASGAKVATLKGHTGRVRALAFGGDAKQPLLASGSDDKTALLWSVPPKKK